MRKISIDAAEALRDFDTFSRSNTRVTMDRVMYLFGNPIARVVGTNLELSNSGHTTATTKERLNAVLDIFGMNEGRIYQYKYDWFMGKGVAFPSGEWVTIPLYK